MKKIRPTIQFSIQQGAFWASFSAIFGYASVFLLANSFSNRQIGYIIAVGSLLSAILQPGFGSLADRSRKCILHRLIVILSLVMILAAGLLLLPGRTFWITALLYGVLVAVLQILTPLTYSIGMFFINKNVPIDFGIARGIGSLSYAGLSSLLGVLTEKYSTSVIIYAVIIIYIVLIIAVVTFHFNGVSEENITETDESGEKNDSVFSFFVIHKRFEMVLVGSVCLFVSHNILSNYMFQIVSYHGYSSAEMGLAISIAAMVEIPVLFLFSVINKKVSSGTLLKISGVFFTIKVIMLLLARSIGMIYFAQCFQILGYGLFSGASVYYVNHTIEDSARVRGQSFMTMTSTIGAILGSLIGGWLLDCTTVSGMLMFSCSIAAIGAVIIIIFGNKGGYSVT